MEYRKSQLAIEYSYRLRNTSPDIWVFWMYADSVANIEQAFKQIAERAKITAWDDTDPEKLKTVFDWLSDEINGRWTMIIDNADDLGAFIPGQSAGQAAGSSQEDLLQWLPQSANGAYIITSRTKSVVRRMGVDDQDMIAVDEMSEDEAVSLLTKKLVDTPLHDDAVALVTAVDRVPLAITQAAGVINSDRPRITVKNFIDALQRKGDEDQVKLLEESIYDARRDGKRSNSIIATWQISFDRIRALRPSAARLLSLMSLFSPQDIPEYVLWGRYGIESPSAQHGRWRPRKRFGKGDAAERVEMLDFHEDWKVLTDFSLISTSEGGSFYSMHALVQFSTMKWLEIHGELHMWKVKFVVLVRENYPHPDCDNIDYIRMMMPHAFAAVMCLPVASPALECIPYIVFHTSGFSSMIVDNDAEERSLEFALRLFDRILGKDHPDTLRCATRYGRCFHQQKKYVEAEKIRRRVYESHKRTLGPDHTDTLESLQLLSFTMECQGKPEGMQLRWGFLDSIARVKGPDDDETIMKLLSAAYRTFADGKYKDAEQCLTRLIESDKRKYGVMHQAICGKLKILGDCVRLQGEWKRAEDIYRQILEIEEENLGREKMLVSETWGEVAKCLNGQARYEDSEKICRRMLNLCEEGKRQEMFSGMVEPPVRLLATALLGRGKLEEAERRGRELIDMYNDEKDEGKMFAFRLLADILQKQGRHAEALQFYQTAFERYADTPEHPDYQGFLDALNAQQELNAQRLLKDSLPENKEAEGHDDLMTKYSFPTLEGVPDLEIELAMEQTQPDLKPGPAGEKKSVVSLATPSKLVTA